mmetsp:Transcript_21070/g.31662  ORF Transcript_21070/g.31662 Transcript_21070/m.31662 type:complete len:129 (+) Transcript_21070:315-701(+)
MHRGGCWVAVAAAEMPHIAAAAAVGGDESCGVYDAAANIVLAHVEGSKLNSNGNANDDLCQCDHECDNDDKSNNAASLSGPGYPTRCSPPVDSPWKIRMMIRMTMPTNHHDRQWHLLFQLQSHLYYNG